MLVTMASTSTHFFTSPTYVYGYIGTCRFLHIAFSYMTHDRYIALKSVLVVEYAIGKKQGIHSYDPYDY